MRGRSLDDALLQLRQGAGTSIALGTFKATKVSEFRRATLRFVAQIAGDAGGEQ
jgi:hypothetical protein